MERILTTERDNDAPFSDRSAGARYRPRGRRTACFGSLLLLVATANALAQSPDSSQSAAASSPIPEAEPVDVATLAPPHPHRLIISGNQFGGVRLINGDTATIEATLYSSGYNSFVADPEQRAFYIAQTSWTRGNHGTREDYLTMIDGRSLERVAEIDLPGRLVSTPKTQSIDISADGKRVYIFNLEPAASVISVDTAAKKVESTVEVPGCGLVYAWGNAGFATLCADGSLTSVTLDAKGQGTLEQSRPFFDAEKDPVFDESVVDRQSGKAFFMSYSGIIYPTQLAAKPAIGPGWSLQQAAGLSRAGIGPGHETWRPGGRCLMALHRSSGRLYILMHMGEHWSQNEAGSQIWVVDTARKKVVRRIEVPTSADAIAVSQDEKPLLYAVAASGRLWVMTAATGEVLRTKTGLSGRSLSVTGF